MVILITGCSDGIGLALASKIAKARPDYKVVATARSESLNRLEAKISPYNNLLILPLDLTKPQEFTDTIKEIIKKFKTIDVLVNNAAIIYRSTMEQVTDEEEKYLFQTNYFGARELILQVLPIFKQQGKGKILNISSVGGMMAMPTMSSYSASKWALEGMSEALYYELKPLNINISLAQLGFVKSQSFKKNKINKVPQNQFYFKMQQGMEEFINTMMNYSSVTPEKIAERILKHMIDEDPPLRVYITFDALIFSWLRRFIPRNIYHQLLNLCLPHNWWLSMKKYKKLLSRYFFRN